MMKWLRKRRERRQRKHDADVLFGLWRRILIGNGVFRLEERRPSWCYITINDENTLHICAAVRLRKAEELALFGELQVPDQSTFIKEGFGR